MEQYLFKSNENNMVWMKQQFISFDAKHLHNATFHYIIEDSRPFGDFRRHAMKKFLRRQF